MNTFGENGNVMAGKTHLMNRLWVTSLTHSMTVFEFAVCLSAKLCKPGHSNKKIIKNRNYLYSCYDIFS